MSRLGLSTYILHPPPTPRLPIRRQRLRKLALLPNIRSLPIKDINGYGDQDRQESQDGRRPLEFEFRMSVADVRVKGGGVHGRDTGEEVARKRVPTSRGGGVRAVGRDHVVDGGHVDGVVGGADEEGEEHGGDPVDVVGGAEGGPGEAEEADGFERGEVEEPVKAGFGLEGVRVAGADGVVPGEEGEEGEPGEEIAD